MPRSRRKRNDIQFCLDANFSIEAVQGVANAVHVSELPQFSSAHRGQSRAADVDIAHWCHANGHVLVTQDSDFTSRKQRAQAIHLAGVEVIFFSYELIGIDQHIQAIRTRVPRWEAQLSKYDHEARVWVQHTKGELRWQKSRHYLP